MTAGLHPGISGSGTFFLNLGNFLTNQNENSSELEPICGEQGR